MGFSLPAWITLIGAVLTAFGAFWTSSESNREQEKLRKEISDKNDQIIKKSEENAYLSQEALKSVTGGDSFANVSPAFKGDGRLTLQVINNGKYPLYDLQITVTDQDLFSRNISKYKNQKDISNHISSIHDAATNVFKVGNLGAKQMKELASYSIDEFGGERNFLINSLARNGSVNQEIKMRPDRKFAIRIINYKGLLFDQVHPNFPKEQLWPDYEEWLAKKVKQEDEENAQVESFSIIE